MLCNFDDPVVYDKNSGDLTPLDQANEPVKESVIYSSFSCDIQEDQNVLAISDELIFRKEATTGGFF